MLHLTPICSSQGILQSLDFPHFYNLVFTPHPQIGTGVMLDLAIAVPTRTGPKPPEVLNNYRKTFSNLDWTSLWFSEIFAEPERLKLAHWHMLVRSRVNCDKYLKSPTFENVFKKMWPSCLKFMLQHREFGQYRTHHVMVDLLTSPSESLVWAVTLFLF